LTSLLLVALAPLALLLTLLPPRLLQFILVLVPLVVAIGLAMRLAGPLEFE
jgi:hypothetical protein